MRTRHAVLLIDPMCLLKVPPRAFGSAEVSNRRPSGCDCFSQYFLHGLVESLAGDSSELMPLGIGVDIGAKQNFIRINVANSRQAMLIEQQRFQLASSCLNKLAKRCFFYGQGIRSESTLNKASSPDGSNSQSRPNRRGFQ